MSKHPHYDLIVQWASDPERWGWERQNRCGDWCKATFAPLACADAHRYRLIDRYADPITEPLKEGEGYWVPRLDVPSLTMAAHWIGLSNDYHRLKHGLCYRSREAAETRAREIIESGGGEV